MNAAHIWCEIICWQCNAQCYGRWVFGSSIPVSEFRLEAKERKWRETTGGEFECPACTKKMLTELGLREGEG